MSVTVAAGWGVGLSFPSAVVPIGDLPDQGQGVKVVRPVGRSTFTPWPWPGRAERGTTADGKLRRGSGVRAMREDGPVPLACQTGAQKL